LQTSVDSIDEKLSTAKIEKRDILSRKNSGEAQQIKIHNPKSLSHFYILLDQSNLTSSLILFKLKVNR